ncbi:MAG: prolyl oligopeptidase family serine peptidase [Bacteroidales bacterium]|nr:prolyl oligopeptidase family serine peptidase [Bacteroidales bacterium]
MSIMKIYLGGFFSMLALVFSQGQLEARNLDKEEVSFEKSSFNSGKDSLPYRFLLPEKTGVNNKIPLLIFLHGSGERGNDNEKQLVHGSAFFAQAVSSKQRPALLVFPQCADDDYWANIDRQRQEDGSISFRFKAGGAPTKAMQLLIGLIDSLAQLDYIDKSRIYVGGLSMGGMGTFELLWRRPELFAAAFPICGGGNTEIVRNYTPETAVWIFHGEADPVVSPNYSIAMFKSMQQAGMPVKLSLYPDYAHNVWDAVFQDRAFLEWLFSIRKQPKL